MIWHDNFKAKQEETPVPQGNTQLFLITYKPNECYTGTTWGRIYWQCSVRIFVHAVANLTNLPIILKTKLYVCPSHKWVQAVSYRCQVVYFKSRNYIEMNYNLFLLFKTRILYYWEHQFGSDLGIIWDISKAKTITWNDNYICIYTYIKTFIHYVTTNYILSIDQHSLSWSALV